MIFKVSICPHELPKKALWEKFFKNLSKVLGTELFFEEVPDFQKELEEIEKKEIVLYYASPSATYLFYKEGYHPIARFSNQIDKFLIIGRDNVEDILKKDFIRVVTINESFYVLPLSQVYYKLNLDFFRIQMILTETHEEIFGKIIKKECDLGIVDQEYLDFYPELKKKVKIFEEFTLETSHYFVLHPEALSQEKVLEALKKVDPEIIKALGYEGIEVFERETIEKLKNIFS
ncbi:MAG: hypothetical protein H0Z16_06880 [Thermodesulfobacterium sp.]|nr:hypothetical protein [Thermodesulfobacterium sp.]